MSSSALATAWRARSMAADAYTVLIARDGHNPANLALEGTTVENGETRPFTPAEESAMVSALDQFMAERKS